MGKFRGYVGYTDNVETQPGIFEEVYLKRIYTGDILEERITRAYQDGVNGKFGTSLRLRIVADKYAFGHFGKICFVELWGQLWEVSSVTPQPPRLELHLGGPFHKNPEIEEVVSNGQ